MSEPTGSRRYHLLRLLSLALWIAWGAAFGYASHLYHNLIFPGSPVLNIDNDFSLRELAWVKGLALAGAAFVTAGTLLAERRRVAALGLLAAALVLHCLGATQSAQFRYSVRGCYATQKTIAGALEMYNLDRNTRCTVLNFRTFQVLASSGYLPWIPVDPKPGGDEYNVDSWRNYRWVNSGNGIRCAEHGAIAE